MRTTVEQSLKESLMVNVLPWAMFFLGVTFYCYAYFLRVTPSIMMDDLLRHFQINAAQFGNLSAFYYYAYTPMQLPVGLLLDRYGVRVVLSLASLVCVAGLWIFISTDHLAMASLGRFMIGFGSAFAYISCLNLAVRGLPPTRFALAATLTTSFGMSAGMLTDVYLIKVVEQVGYYHALFFGLVVGLVISFFVFLIIRDKPHADERSNAEPRMTFKELLQAMGMAFRNKQILLIGLVGWLMYLMASVFLDIWGIPFLKAVYHLSNSQASQTAAMVFLGWIIGSPMIGVMSDKMRRRRMPLAITTFIGAILTLIIFYGSSYLNLYGL